MIHSDHYKNYRGPKLVKAILISPSPIGGKIDEDITESIKAIYGPECNWQGYLWTYKEAFGENCYGKNFKCEFKSEDGIDHWFYGFINDIDQYFNPPLHTPINQSN